MKKAYIVILCLVTIVVILVGVGRWFGPSFGIFGSWQKGETVSEEIVLTDSITGISMNMNLGDVDIESGEALKVSYTFPEELVPEVTVENGILTIEQSAKNIQSTLGNDRCKMTVTIPEGTELTSIDVTMDAGDLDVDELTADTLSVTMSAGDLDVDELTADTLSVMMSAGDLTVSDSMIGTVNAENDFGNVTLDVTADKVSASVDAGDIEIKTNALTIVADCDLGNIDIITEKDASLVDIRATCDLGEVEVNGEKW